MGGTTGHGNIDGSPAIIHPRLTGARCRCGACGENFNSVSAFDAHRTGSYWPIQRVCLTRIQMCTRGMSLNPAGFWITETRSERAASRGRAAGSGDRAPGGPRVGVRP